MPVPPGRGGPQRIPRPRDAIVGGPPPWAGLAPDARRPSLEQVVTAVAERGRRRVVDGGGRPRSATGDSSVLALLHDGPGGPELVLTRRSPRLRSHAHEVAFPGGRREPGDADLWATALREAHEEVGLDPATVALVGELDAFVTVGSRSRVHPFVATVPERPDLVPEPSEVESILHVPVAELLEPGVWREERWPIAGVERAITFFELEGDTLWGATGAMVRQLLAVVTGTDDAIVGGPG